MVMLWDSVVFMVVMMLCEFLLVEMVSRMLLGWFSVWICLVKILL